MTRVNWRAANLLNPVPLVLIACGDDNNANVMTAAWAGTICSDPVMVSVSIRKKRYSYDIIKKTGQFTINLTNKNLVHYADYVGTYSGRKIDKFNLQGELKVTKTASKIVNAPTILESPLTLECIVKEIKELGSHDLFIAEVVNTSIDDQYLDSQGRLDLKKADLVCYCHGEYYCLGKKIGSFGYSSKKSMRNKRKKSLNK